MKRPVRAFCSIAAQPDNLGDVVIRRTMVEWIAGTGSEMVVYVGDMPQSYIDACSIPESSRRTASALRFELLLMISCLTRRTVIVFAPGPQVLTSRPRAIGRALVNLGNLAMVRASGGRALAIGRSLRGSGFPARLIERLTLRLFHIYAARDALSGRAVGVELETCPDLAFAAGAPSVHVATRRDLFAISLRGDRMVDLARVGQAVRSARARGLTPVFVTQVQRDEANHQRLGNELGVDVVGWTDASHSAQLRSITATYRRSALILTDRLHAAILGALEGALPVDFSQGPQSKIRDTLDGVIFFGTWSDDAGRVQQKQHQDISAERDELATALAAAGGQLADLRRRVELHMVDRS